MPDFLEPPCLSYGPSSKTGLATKGGRPAGGLKLATLAAASTNWIQPASARPALRAEARFKPARDPGISILWKA